MPETEKRTRNCHATKKTAPTLPVDAFVNKYNFLRLSDAILEKLGWSIDKNVDVTLDVKDGALIVKKK